MRPLAVTMIAALLIVSVPLPAAGSSHAPAARLATGVQAAVRSVVVISDLHMGLGHDAEGVWRPREDFRWPAALEGFLAAVAAEGTGGVDLLIAGDFLEL